MIQLISVPVQLSKYGVTTKMAWGKSFSGTTTEPYSHDITSTVFTPSVFNSSLHHLITSGYWNVAGTIAVGKTAIDRSANYSQRYMFNGTGERTDVSVTTMELGYDGWEQFMVSYSCNIAQEEKLFIGFVIEGQLEGAGYDPKRKDGVGKWANTSDQFDIYATPKKSNARQFTTPSNMTVLGSDLTPVVASSATISDGAVFYETDTNKSYVLSSNIWTEL